MTINSVNSSNLNILAQSSSVNKNAKAEHVAKVSDNGLAEKPGKTDGKAKMDAIELSSKPAASSPSLAETKKSLLEEIGKDKDSATISALKSKLESGQYKIDAQEIAKSMLSSVK